MASVDFGGGGRSATHGFWPAPPRPSPGTPDDRVVTSQQVGPKKRPAAKEMQPRGQGQGQETPQKKKAKAPGTPTTTATASGQSAVDAPICDSDTPEPANGNDVKKRAAYGTAGTWLGRRPPKDPVKLEAFLQKKALWEEEREKNRLAKDDEDIS